MRSFAPIKYSLPFALFRAREKIMVPVRELLAHSEISEQQWRVLRLLEEHGPLEPSQLAKLAVLYRPSITRIVQNMLTKDLILKQAHSTDGRKFTLSITPLGREVIAGSIAPALKISEMQRARFGPEKYDLLVELLLELEALDEVAPQE